jgi:hypothetical protein
MKRKISVTLEEGIYNKLLEIWKKEQAKSLKSENPKPITISEIVEKIVKKGLEK